MIVLKNWSICSSEGLASFISPELSRYYLRGNVYNHPRFTDGTLVSTSFIIDMEDKENYKMVTTYSGSKYILHKANVDPNVKEKIPDYYDKMSVS